MDRPTWSEYFMDLATRAASRATCPRASVGCVAVSAERDVLGTGYNGALPGVPHCTEVGCDLDAGDHCMRAMHAEANLVARAAKRGVALVGATLYTTHVPCWPCYRLLISAGIVEIVFGASYRPDRRIWDDGIARGITIRPGREGVPA